MSKGSVEVFEVGKSQLDELVNLDMSFNCGDYVVVSMGAVFGSVSNELDLIERYCSKYWACHSAEEMQRISCTFAAAYGRACVCEYEVWHVVDDDDLWLAWEHEAWIARMLDAGMYDKVYVLPSGTEDASGTEDDACGFEGEHTDWHVYDGRDCVMDLERVPQVLYKLETLDECMSVLETKWYTDEQLFAGDMGFALAQGCKLWLGDVSPMSDAVTIVDDYDCMLDDYGDGSVLEVTLLAATA